MKDRWLTLAEAEKKYNRDTSTLRRNIRVGNMFSPDEVRKISYIWQIRESALEREYGQEIETPESLLKTLDQEDLLGFVGVTLLDNIKEFPQTISILEDWLGSTSRKEQLETLSKSSLCSGNDERAIEEFIAEEEIQKIKEVLKDES